MFPHPVLRRGGVDYVEGRSFSSDVAARAKGAGVRLAVRYRLESEFLSGLVRDGAASYAAVARCRRTGQRRLLKSDSGVSWDLDGGDFRGTLTVDTYVVAERALPAFDSDEHDPEMRGMAGDVPAGSILAVGGRHDVLLDAVEGGPRAAMQIVCRDGIGDGLYHIDLDRELVEIAMSRRTMEGTRRLKERYPRVLLPALYLAAAERAVRELGEHGGRLWADAIRAALERAGLDPDDVEDPNHAAQLIMRGPFRCAIELAGGDG